jgi:hypothetical protein
MASRQADSELNQLSRILFDDAASNWYVAAGIEIFAGILGAVLSITGVSGGWALLGAMVGLTLFGWAYYCDCDSKTSTTSLKRCAGNRC